MRGLRHVLLSTTLLLAVACGGDGDTGGDEPRGAASGPPVALSGTVSDKGTRDAGTATDVALDDFSFAPTYLRSSPNAVVTLRLENTGEVPHTFTITDRGVDETVQPGATAETTVTLPSAGAVRFFCRFHEAQGMQGAFYFNPGDTVAPGGGAPGGTTPAPDGDGAYNP